MTNNKENTIFLTCTCKCGVLQLEKDQEFNQFNLSVWRQNGGQLSFLDKLRWTRNVWFGKLWADEIVLEEKDVVKLRDFVDQNLNEEMKEKPITSKQPFNTVVSCLLIKGDYIWLSKEKDGWFNGYTTSISMVSQPKEDPRAYIPDLIDYIYKETQLNKTTILDEFRFEHLVTLENVDNIKKHIFLAIYIRPGEEVDFDKSKREEWELVEFEKVNNMFGLLPGLNKAVELLK